jgi:hypothetical protein
MMLIERRWLLAKICHRSFSLATWEAMEGWSVVPREVQQLERSIVQQIAFV